MNTKQSTRYPCRTDSAGFGMQEEKFINQSGQTSIRDTRQGDDL